MTRTQQVNSTLFNIRDWPSFSCVLSGNPMDMVGFSYFGKERKMLHSSGIFSLFSTLYRSSLGMLSEPRVNEKNQNTEKKCFPI